LIKSDGEQKSEYLKYGIMIEVRSQAMPRRADSSSDGRRGFVIIERK
jgi:hypothetical protein